MKISAISSYNYKQKNLKHSQAPSFEGKLHLQETANKVFTKKNLFEASLLLVLLSKLTDIADIDVSEIVDFVKNMAFIIVQRLGAKAGLCCPQHVGLH